MESAIPSVSRDGQEVNRPVRIQWWRRSAARILDSAGPGTPSFPILDYPLTMLPEGVARPMLRMRDTRLPAQDRLASGAFSVFQMLRTTGTLLLADYLDHGQRCSRVERTRQELEREGWPAWSRLCQWLCYYWSGDLPERPSRPTRFPRLVEGWKSVSRRRLGLWSELLGLSPELRVDPSAGDLDAVLQARGADQAGKRTDCGSSGRRLRKLLPLASAVALELFVPQEFVLLRRGPGGVDRVMQLHGAGPTLPTVPLRDEWQAALRATGLAVLVGDEVMGVYPGLGTARAGVLAAPELPLDDPTDADSPRLDPRVPLPEMELSLIPEQEPDELNPPDRLPAGLDPADRQVLWMTSLGSSDASARPLRPVRHVRVRAAAAASAPRPIRRRPQASVSPAPEQRRLAAPLELPIELALGR